jgi:hypothetical protein
MALGALWPVGKGEGRGVSVCLYSQHFWISKNNYCLKNNFFNLNPKNADYGERGKDPAFGDTIVFARPIFENNNFYRNCVF